MPRTIPLKNPVPVEVEKPSDISTSSVPLIKAWSVEKTPHTFIYANARSRTIDKK
ncbi:hypothetical protein [Maribacter aestuarii]|uniref:hypothetical protein n=1 Tax=Maribacter aestuarii TaxID=1130723 RepID=UPI00248B42EA|nr:hypothetical protein [Maribacter aestuarii]